MIRGLAAMLCFGAAACFAPTYDHPACSAEGDCPSGFACAEPAHVCQPIVAIDAPDRVDAPDDPDAPAIDAPAIDAPPIDAPVDGVTPVPDAPRCAAGEMQSPTDPHRCFHLVTMLAQTWSQARTRCMAIGGDLADVRDAQEEMIVRTLGQNATAGAWLGANDSVLEGAWMWTSGAPFSYTDWGTGQPSAQTPDEDCMRYQLQTINGWADISCTAQLANMICLVPASA